MSTNTSDNLHSELERDIEHRSPREEILYKLRRDYIGLLGLVGLVVVLVATVVGPMVTPYQPLEPNYAQIQQAPSMAHPMGTDHLGRDTFSRVLLGGRFSLLIGVGSILFATFFGVLFGGVAGYTGRDWLDELLMRAMDLLIAFPALLLGLAIVGMIGKGSLSVGGVQISNLHKMILIIGLVYTPRFARVTRGAVLQESSKAYVKMARLEGASHLRVFSRELLVNILSPLLVLFTYRIGSAMIVAAGFGFLGIGITPPKPGWGVMLASGRSYIASGSWWMVVFPGLALAITIMSLNLFGDAVRDALDPNVSTDEQV